MATVHSFTKLFFHLALFSAFVHSIAAPRQNKDSFDFHASSHAWASIVNKRNTFSNFIRVLGWPWMTRKRENAHTKISNQHAGRLPTRA
jgi:hypothetical protein